MTNDSLEILKKVLSMLIQHWTDAALEVQAYRRVTEHDSTIQAKLAVALSNSPISDRRRRATDARNRVLLLVASGDYPEASGVLGEISALLGRTPNYPDPFGQGAQ